jgi:branched-chain amino acid transport system substrate-binding protein
MYGKIRRLIGGLVALGVVVPIAVMGAGPASAQAKGDPIVIGVYTPADNPTFTAPELIPAAEAAAKFVNKVRDGIGGRPVKIVSCTTDYTPDSLTRCANELFQQNPDIIMPGPDASAFTVFNVFADAGFPLIGGASFTPPEYTSDLRAMFNGFSASLFPGMVHFAVKELGATKKVVALSFDDGISPALVKVFMDPTAKALGLDEVQFVPTQPGTTDFSAPLAAAVSTDPDAILVFGVPCAPIDRAYASLGTDIPLIQPSNCNDDKTLEEAGSAAEGTYYVNQFLAPSMNPKNADVKLFQKILKKYGKGSIPITDFSSAGVASILNIEAALDKTDLATATPASVLAVFKSAVAQKNFLAEPYTCNPAPVAKWPGICSGSVYLDQVKKGKLRRLTEFVPIEDLYAAAG